MKIVFAFFIYTSILAYIISYAKKKMITVPKLVNSLFSIYLEPTIIMLEKLKFAHPVASDNE